MTTLSQLPPNLPAPVDDGACNHLTNMKLPGLSLSSTQGGTVNLATLTGMVDPMCRCPMAGSKFQVPEAARPNPVRSEIMLPS